MRENGIMNQRLYRMIFILGQKIMVCWKGHPLMYQVLPEWIKDSERSVQKIDKDIKRHVKNLILSYPQIDHWDLYNEVPGII